MSIVSKKELAEIFGKSPRWIGDQIANGMPTEGGGGRGKILGIDSAQAIEWYLNSQISKKYGDADPGAGETDEDRALKRVKREEIELKIAVRKSELIPIEGFEDIVLVLSGEYAAQLDGLSSRVAGVLAGMDDPAEIREYIHDETRQIRAATAEQIMARLQEIVAEADRLYDTLNH